MVNNPLRHTDPTGHCLDDYCGMPGGPGSPARATGNRNAQYACVRGFGCFDTKHLRNFPNPGGQQGLWDRFQREAGMSRQFALPIESSLGGGSALKITYRVAGGLPQGQWAAVAMGIFLDYAREYESAQFIRSGFANQDMPSNYVGMLAAINGISPDAILMTLAGAAGLNAYIPLLIVAVLAHAQVIHLHPPFDMLSEWWVIGVLVVLLAIEVVVDKVPGADHVNDVIQTIVRPAAGAVLFAANSGIVTDISPVLAIIVGLLTAGVVHGGKVVARPAINVSTAGIGAPVVSFVEDVVSVVGSVLAVLAPALFVLFVAAIGYLVYRAVRRLKRAQRRNQPV